MLQLICILFNTINKNCNIHMYMCVYIYIYREREREGERDIHLDPLQVGVALPHHVDDRLRAAGSVCMCVYIYIYNIFV